MVCLYHKRPCGPSRIMEEGKGTCRTTCVRACGHVTYARLRRGRARGGRTGDGERGAAGARRQHGGGGGAATSRAARPGSGRHYCSAPDGRILSWNDGAAALYGWTAAAAVGRTTHDLLGTRVLPGGGAGAETDAALAVRGTGRANWSTRGVTARGWWSRAGRRCCAPPTARRRRSCKVNRDLAGRRRWRRRWPGWTLRRQRRRSSPNSTRPRLCAHCSTAARRLPGRQRGHPAPGRGRGHPHRA